MLDTVKRTLTAVLLLPALIQAANGQSQREDIYSASVFYQKRVALEKDLRERITGRNMSLPLDSNSEDKYLSACWAISQFLIWTPEVEHGLDALFNNYPTLSIDTKKALLEAAYAVAPTHYTTPINNILEKEENPKLFSLCAVYLYCADTSIDNSNKLKIRMVFYFFKQKTAYEIVTIVDEH